jgi:hypothetical protein
MLSSSLLQEGSHYIVTVQTRRKINDSYIFIKQNHFRLLIAFQYILQRDLGVYT